MAIMPMIIYLKALIIYSPPGRDSTKSGLVIKTKIKHGST